MLLQHRSVVVAVAAAAAEQQADVADWAQEDTELPGGNQHLWEESWDDDDTSDDFAAQLR